MTTETTERARCASRYSLTGHPGGCPNYTEAGSEFCVEHSYRSVSEPAQPSQREATEARLLAALGIDPHRVLAGSLSISFAECPQDMARIEYVGIELVPLGKLDVLIDRTDNGDGDRRPTDSRKIKDQPQA